MIRAHHLREDESALQGGLERLADEEVVDAPAHVSLPGAALHVPPAVMPRACFEDAESVKEAVLKQFVDPRALLGQESRNLPVLFRTGEVDVAMRGVDVPADDQVLVAFFAIPTHELQE